MARLHTGDTRATAQEAPGRPPRGDEHLDEWFARRLEAQGIGRARRRPLATARVLSVLGLIVAVVALGWVVASLAGSSPSTAASTHHTQRTQPTSTARTTVPAWKRIRLTVLNGFGGPGAAGVAATQLKARGFNVVGKGTGGTSTTATYVAYAPGFQIGAGIIARKLGLAAPVPIAQATGVTGTQKSGIVLVLGSNLLG